MADPLQKLAPPIAPPMPAPASHAGVIDAVLPIVIVLLLVPAAAWLIWKRGIPAWRRRRLRKALDALPEGPDVCGMAQRLVELVRTYRLQPEAAWWQAADALRFQRPSEGSPEDRRALAALKRQIACMERKRD